MQRTKMGSGPNPVADCGCQRDPAHYLNRELSWVEFDRNVLDEAKDTTHPLLERVKFLSIFANNLDEFFMVRVAGLRRQRAKGVLEAPPDGLTPARQLEEIRCTLLPLLGEESECWHSDLLPALGEAGIRIRRYDGLGEKEKERLREYFSREIFPVLTPLAFDKSHPFPFISNLSLNLAITVRDPESGNDLFARLKIPTPLFPRLIQIPADDVDACNRDAGTDLVFIEDLVASNLGLLFPGMEVIASYPFRITRDADLEIQEDDASDLLTAIEESVEMRRIGAPVRIEVDQTMPEGIRGMLARKLSVEPRMFDQVTPPIGKADLMLLHSLDRPELKDAPFVPTVPGRLENQLRIFPEIMSRDILVFHPYDSFQPIVNFLWQAATDPDVLAIKMTLYRVGQNSPIVEALLKARENNKAVSALIELKARFDEENNIGWARALERAGVHVVYGLPGLKVHAKLCMVIRKEKSGIARYVHLGTGNYNAATSRVYTDIGIFTANDLIGQDAADLFNALTGYARIPAYRKLLVSPGTMRNGLLARIEREISLHRKGGNGAIAFKMNALQDRECIDALYRASQAGVRVQLQVRGICCLRPGIPGISENITVSAIVGRFLEHARIYCFNNGGDAEILIGSADMMPRNLDRRVETLMPVLDPEIRRRIAEVILPVHLKDTVKARRLRRDGKYERVQAGQEEKSLNAQDWLVEHRGCWHDPS
ncbi:MAG: polyphosphate kinase 1 [Methanoregulaceae archaeon]|nr:polyphosphate kinase 1 [Methanoregulaceae archaeon]